MTWNHRVFRWKNDDGSFWYDVREVHYDASGDPNGVTSTHVAPGGDTLSDLSDELGRMLDACNRPALVFDGAEIAEAPFAEIWKEATDGMMGFEVKPLIDGDERP